MSYTVYSDVLLTRVQLDTYNPKKGEQWRTCIL